ncbi:hypothetical protein [Crocinitomix catalasitica]|uniref:hypothetical protein n=1 Tax=Crocinitomix catalasitica TaxID=184607 RepID=UPI0004835B29|nr:hypothetical protein [Crocinitomix catalasitica]
MLKLFKISILLLSLSVLGQGPSMSLHDLKEAYLEKRSFYYRTEFKTLPETKQTDLNNLVQILKENGPNSFEFNLVNYINSNYDLAAKNNLLKAYELKPDDRRVRLEMFAYYVMVDDHAKQVEFAKKIKSQFTTGELNYYRSMLKSVKADVIIFSGKQDAYPAMVVNLLEQVNAKATLVSLDLIQNKTYKKQVEARLKIANTTFVGNESKYLQMMIAANPANRIIASTVPQRYLSKIMNDVYLIGYFYEYKAKNQLNSLTYYYKRVQPSINDIKEMSARDKKLYGNYLPALLTLYKLSLAQGLEVSKLKSDIETLATILNKTTAVNQIIDAYGK